MSLHPEVLMAAAYASFLTAVSYLLRRHGGRVRQRSAAGDWAARQAARFERALAAVLLVVAGVILAAAGLRHRGGQDLGLTLVLLALVSHRAIRALFQLEAEV